MGRIMRGCMRGRDPVLGARGARIAGAHTRQRAILFWAGAEQGSRRAMLRTSRGVSRTQSRNAARDQFPRACGKASRQRAGNRTRTRCYRARDYSGRTQGIATPPRKTGRANFSGQAQGIAAHTRCYRGRGSSGGAQGIATHAQGIALKRGVIAPAVVLGACRESQPLRGVIARLVVLGACRESPALCAALTARRAPGTNRALRARFSTRGIAPV